MRKFATWLLILDVVIGGVISPFFAIQFAMAAGVGYLAVLLIALLFQPYFWASQSSIIFVSGAATGLGLAVVLAFLSIHTKVDIDKTIVAATILLPLLGGIGLLYLFIKNNRCNLTFKRDWLKPAP